MSSAAPPNIKPIRPRGPLEELGSEACAPFPMKSPEKASLRKGAEKDSCPEGVTMLSAFNSKTDDAVGFEEVDIDASAWRSVDSALLFKSECGAADPIFLSRVPVGGDMSTSPAISSNVGAPPE